MAVNFTPIVTGAAANAVTINNPLHELDNAIEGARIGPPMETFTLNTGQTATLQKITGFLIVVAPAENASAMFELRGAADEVVKLDDTQAIFDILVGLPNSINVAPVGGDYLLANTRISTLTLYVIYLGVVV